MNRRIWILWYWRYWATRPGWVVAGVYGDRSEATRARQIWRDGPGGYRTRLTSVLAPVPAPLGRKVKR